MQNPSRMIFRNTPSGVKFHIFERLTVAGERLKDHDSLMSTVQKQLKMGEFRTLIPCHG